MEPFVGELVPNVVEEVLALGFGVEERLMLVCWKGEVAVDLSAMESQVKSATWPIIGCSGQQLRLQGLPVQIEGVYLIQPCAHDPKIVGTISLRDLWCHAASDADGL